MSVKMTAEEKKWRAESDAETMARYLEIMRDPKRKTAAINAAKAKVSDLTKRVQALQFAAGGKLKKKK